MDEHTPPHLALFQPDIPQNTGTLIRMGACLGFVVDIIEPAGFPTADRDFLRAGMDYIDLAEVHRHASWAAFDHWRRAANRRLVLVETGAGIAYTDFAFAPGDILLFGRESAGTPAEVAASCDAHITIPMRPNVRSLNVALAAAIVMSEALRQTATLPVPLPQGSDR